MSKRPVIALCSSLSFYKHLVAVGDELERLGFAVILPLSARKMKATGDFSAGHTTWRNNPADYPKKAAYIRAHFDEVARADAILVINDDKPGKPHYIGGNVLMEMAIAFHLNKPIFILNEPSPESPLLEEILGSLPVILNGRVDTFAEAYRKATA